MNLLRADCDNCAGLCCVALAFTRSADFAFDKAAGDPCVNLPVDSRCEIHPELRERGMRGCTVFDCIGAGQRVTAASGDWRGHPDGGASVFAVFPVMRQLHELLWYLQQALRMPGAGTLHDEVLAASVATEELATLPSHELLAADVGAHWDAVVGLLGRVSALVRAGVLVGEVSTGSTRDLEVSTGSGRDGEGSGPWGSGGKHRMGPRADLIGARLSRTDLGGADLRGAYLIAADLTGARLAYTDLIGADLRDADLRGADLPRAMFLTQPQINAAIGDASTVLPVEVERPTHWAS
ncbi:pentapeptide repeat-containing protein [soil metagenome]